MQLCMSSEKTHFSHWTISIRTGIDIRFEAEYTHDLTLAQNGNEKKNNLDMKSCNSNQLSCFKNTNKI